MPVANSFTFVAPKYKYAFRQKRNNQYRACILIQKHFITPDDRRKDACAAATGEN
jgi:hypothetical protein